MTDRLLSFEEVSALMETLPLSADMIAIDGAPLSGKSTLARNLADMFGLGLLSLDDFVRPEEDWEGALPAYPFPYFRNDEFASVLKALRDEGQCFYYPFDWEIGFVSPEPRFIVRDKPILIEGVSVLDPALTAFYDLRFYVESDLQTPTDAQAARDGGRWADHWRDLFLPSVELYAATEPKTRADFLVKGRGL